MFFAGLTSSGWASAQESAAALIVDVLKHGTRYVYTVALQDVNVNGNYEVDYSSNKFSSARR
ncbi:MAG: hypothetical protein NVSMB62_28940 [Acidobacteriaceae bacterium]